MTELADIPERRGGSSTRGGAVRVGILEQAARLFAEKGFEGTSLMDIAHATDLTRPALYHYFNSKDEILATLVEQVSGGAAEKLQDIVRGTMAPSDKLREATRALVLDRAEAPERFRMLDRSETALPEPAADRHRQAKRTALTAMTNIITDGIRSAEFRETDERLAALSVIGMCNWVAWWYHPGRDADAKLVAETIADSAVAMLARPAHRIPADPGIHGAIAQLRQDLDYLARIADSA
ncbi:MAG TPA: TetR/AcrR family transcriptional regulator [Micromonosporaceae bacterium]|jgi:AcrR family transcriptional regulator